jgi:hypothetical protein
MISFFRKIRHRLLRESQVSRYLIYAFGEILLVMVGILLAMYINNLNEDRKNRIKEQAYIQSLIVDLNQDLEMLHEVVEHNTSKITGLDSLLTYKQRDLSIPALNDSVYFLFARYVSNFSQYQRNTRTLQQLESTGDYILIKKQVADSLSKFIQRANNVEEQGAAYKTSLFDSMNAGFKLIDFSSLLDADYIQRGKLTGKHFPPMSADDQIRKEFFNRVALLKAITSNYVHAKLKEHAKLLKELISFLEESYELSVQL